MRIMRAVFKRASAKGAVRLIGLKPVPLERLPMMRQLCWIEKLDDGVKRDVRVSVERGKVAWQFKRSDQDRFDYTTPPTREDWDNFMERMENRYQRRNVSFDDLQLARQAMVKALSES